jgi:hypothetical protein
MTSNLKRTLGGMLSLAVVLSAAEARAQSLEKPGAPPPEAAPAAAASSGPTTFGDTGQLTLSAERLFGYSWRHRTQGNLHDSQSSFSLLADAPGVGGSGYSWPRLGFDGFIGKGISLGGAASFFRLSGDGPSLTGYELAPRVGYAAVIGPWLTAWPRLGFTYLHSSTESFEALTIEVPLVVAVNPRLGVLIAPAADIGVGGSSPAPTGGTASTKTTDIGLSFGLALLF